MKRRRTEIRTKPRCVLDSGGVTALIGRLQKARAWLRWIITQGGDVIVPTPVLVECTTGNGARDAEVNRVRANSGRFGNSCAAPDQATARLAGTLRFAAGSDDDIDALVAAEAARHPRFDRASRCSTQRIRRLLVRTGYVSVRRM